MTAMYCGVATPPAIRQPYEAEKQEDKANMDTQSAVYLWASKINKSSGITYT